MHSNKKVSSRACPIITLDSFIVRLPKIDGHHQQEQMQKQTIAMGKKRAPATTGDGTAIAVVKNCIIAPRPNIVERYLFIGKSVRDLVIPTVGTFTCEDYCALAEAMFPIIPLNIDSILAIRPEIELATLTTREDVPQTICVGTENPVRDTHIAGMLMEIAAGARGCPRCVSWLHKRYSTGDYRHLLTGHAFDMIPMMFECGFRRNTCWAFTQYGGGDRNIVARLCDSTRTEAWHRDAFDIRWQGSYVNQNACQWLFALWQPPLDFCYKTMRVCLNTAKGSYDGKEAIIFRSVSEDCGERLRDVLCEPGSCEERQQEMVVSACVSGLTGILEKLCFRWKWLTTPASAGVSFPADPDSVASGKRSKPSNHIPLMTQIAAVIRLCLRDPEDRDPDLRRNATTLRWLGHQWSLRSLAQTIPGVFAGAVSACVATDNAVVLKELVSEIKMDSVEDLRKIIDQCSYRPGCENAIRSWIFLLHPEIEDVSLGWRQKTLNEYAVCDGVAQPSPKVYPYHRIVRFNNSKRRKRGAPVLISPRTTPFINKRFMALFASSSSTPARKPQNDDDCE